MMANPVPWWQRGVIRKLVTRPLWWWHKRRPWPIRQRIFRLPPYPVAAEAGARLITQAAPGALADAAWMARSFLAFLDRPPANRLALTLYVDSDDPAVVADAAGRWQRLFPGSAVRTTWEIVERVAAGAPALAGLGRVNPMGRKLAVVVDAQAAGNVLYADSDLLMFHDAPELADALRQNGPALYNQEPLDSEVEPVLAAHARGLGWPAPARCLNAGLLYLPRGTIALSRVEELLAGGQHDARSWMVEQMAVSLLLPGATPLPGERYVVSARGQFYGEADEDYDRLAVRHFIATVRHRMYARGMPLLWRRWHEKSP